jgi:hypothetical protein
VEERGGCGAAATVVVMMKQIESHDRKHAETTKIGAIPFGQGSIGNGSGGYNAGGKSTGKRSRAEKDIRTCDCQCQ